MLESLSPTDPVLLLAVVDGPFTALPRDVRAWFGPTKENRVALVGATAGQREAFFDNLLKDIQRPPNQFPDGIKRKRRVLEELPIAPPLEPRAPTAAELAVQEESDRRTMLYLKHRLGPILTELKRKFKRFTKRAVVSLYFPHHADILIIRRKSTRTTISRIRRTTPSFNKLRPSSPPPPKCVRALTVKR